MWSKKCVGFLSIIGFIRIFWAIFQWEEVDHELGYHVYKTITFLLLNIYICFIIMSMNKTALKQCMSQFTFWFKLLTMIQGMLCLGIVEYVFEKNKDISWIDVIAKVLEYLTALLIKFNTT